MSAFDPSRFSKSGFSAMLLAVAMAGQRFAQGLATRVQQEPIYDVRWTRNKNSHNTNRGHQRAALKKRNQAAHRAACRG